jgi:hypothetical protein
MVFAAAWCAIAGPVLADDAADMAKTVTGFYGAYDTFHPSDGIPDAKGRAKYAPYISPPLEKLLADADRAEDAFAKANKGSPPLLEGDLFTSNFEGATSHKLGACEAKSKTCKVDLVYDDRATAPKDKPVTWTDTVHLVMTPAGWRVDDIGYGATWAFGNKGRMRDTLTSVIRNASD